MIVELLLAERNHVCSVCVSNGHCELQSLADALGVTSVRFPLPLSQAPGGPLAGALRDRSQPLHAMLALRARLRGGGGRARVGHHGRAASTRA